MIILLSLRNCSRHNLNCQILPSVETLRRASATTYISFIMWDLTVTLDAGRRVMVCVLEAFFILLLHMIWPNRAITKCHYPFSHWSAWEISQPVNQRILNRIDSASQHVSRISVFLISACFSYQRVSRISGFLVSVSFSYQWASHISMADKLNFSVWLNAVKNLNSLFQSTDLYMRVICFSHQHASHISTFVT